MGRRSKYTIFFSLKQELLTPPLRLHVLSSTFMVLNPPLKEFHWRNLEPMVGSWFVPSSMLSNHKGSAHTPCSLIRPSINGLWVTWSSSSWSPQACNNTSNCLWFVLNIQHLKHPPTCQYAILHHPPHLHAHLHLANLPIQVMGNPHQQCFQYLPLSPSSDIHLSPSL